MTWLPPLGQRAKVEVYAKAEGFELVELLSDGFESAEDPAFFNKGFQMLEDRKADFLLPLKLEALIIPSPNGGHRTTDQTLPMFHQDSDRVGLRRRRQYDSRRTFISLSQADRARKDILRWVTHGATGDIVDLYTTLPWAALCAEVEKLRIELWEDRVLEFRQLASGACDSPCDSRSERSG